MISTRDISPTNDPLLMPEIYQIVQIVSIPAINATAWYDIYRHASVALPTCPCRGIYIICMTANLWHKLILILFACMENIFYRYKMQRFVAADALGPLLLTYINQTSIRIRICISNYIHINQWDIITHLYPNFNLKEYRDIQHVMKLWHGWVITSLMTWMSNYIPYDMDE